MTAYIREPFNALSHLAGALLSFVALLAMVIKAAYSQAPALHITAVLIFGISLMLLYTASTVYHTVKARPGVIAFFRKLDHSMIFLLIAGSYAPFCLIALEGTLGWTVFGIVSALGTSGIFFKMIWFHAPRWLSTAIYILMGWLIVFAAGPLAGSLSAAGLWLLISGGILYTVGGIIYWLKPDFLSSRYLGFHEIFHLFILLGSTCHFLAVYIYVL
ncbi:hemolysin III family protein [Planococcus sp. ISL-109]|uniref:PAQR family membrane homeostasis protein TrhA n=1 Tax=Planococcus sp. ISL-109 TaxID=2819166 RepID=UPI001BE9FB4B|nr:hemolysin III family protein [Planococcus sp. ISL-109]MBT2581396.1 hemolysin III family protein [Planococcus sp. ISL-109]